MTDHEHTPEKDHNDMPTSRLPDEDPVAVSRAVLDVSGIRHLPPDGAVDTRGEYAPRGSDTVPGDLIRSSFWGAAASQPLLHLSPTRKAGKMRSRKKPSLLRFILKGLFWTAVALFMVGLVIG